MSQKTFDGVQINVQHTDYSGKTPSGSGSDHLDNLVSNEALTNQLGKTKRWIEIFEDNFENMPDYLVYQKTGCTITADSTDTTKCSIAVTVPSSTADIKAGYVYKIASIAVSPTYTGTLKVGDLLVANKDNPTVTASWILDTDWSLLVSSGKAETYPKFTYVEDDVYSAVTGDSAPTWESNKYYSRSGHTYTLTTSEPVDWSTNYTSYYTKGTGNYIAIDYGS